MDLHERYNIFLLGYKSINFVQVLLKQFLYFKYKFIVYNCSLFLVLEKELMISLLQLRTNDNYTESTLRW